MSEPWFEQDERGTEQFWKRDLQDAQLHLARFGDHGLVPGRVPHQFHLGFADAGEGFDLGLGFLGEDGAHAAAGGGQRHLDGDVGAVAVARGDQAIVDEAEVHDVDRDFRVVTGLELVPDPLFINRGAGMNGRGGGCLGGDFEAEGVGVLRADAGEAHLRGDGVTAAEGLGDEDSVPGGQDDGVARGDLNRGTIAGQGAFGIFVHGIGEVTRACCAGQL